MPFDADELKQRIRRQRVLLAGGEPDLAPPASSLAPAPQPRKSLMSEPLQARRPRGERLYRLPLVGYVLRIIAAVLNFPHILKNLERHYAVTGGDRARIDTTIGALRHEMSQSTATLEDRLRALEKGQAEALQADLRALKAELQDLKQGQAGKLEAALAETARLRGELDRVRAASVRLACALPEFDTRASVPGEDGLIRAVPPAPGRRSAGRPAALSASEPRSLAISRRQADAEGAGRGVPALALEQVSDLTQETALALTTLPTGASVLDFGGGGLDGYARALRVFGLKPRRPEAEELDMAALPTEACGALWVDDAPDLTLDGLERALSVLGGRLPRDAITVVRGGAVRFEPSLANLIAGHRGFRLKRMLSAPEGSTAFVLLRD